MKENDKRQRILDALQMLITAGRRGACSVSEIAIQAGIGKGSIYYYFASKEEMLDALIDRTYTAVIDACKAEVEKSELAALPKIALLLSRYTAFRMESGLDTYLHEPQNAHIHQKSLAKILTLLAPVLADIIKQGVREGTFSCAYPQELSELLLTDICFLFDPGIFPWSAESLYQKRRALAVLAEQALSLPAGSMSFLYGGDAPRKATR